MKVSFLTTAHIPKDDRIYYHQAVSLVEAGIEAEIISSTSELKKKEGKIEFNCFDGSDMTKSIKVKLIIKALKKSKPDVVICSEPLAIYAADKFRKKAEKKVRIIFDVTEWYPSKKNIAGLRTLKKIVRFFLLLGFNITSAIKVDAFIFGEWYKSLIYRFLFPYKEFIYISYYPNLKYIHYTNPDLNDKELHLSYSGKLSVEKGFDNFLNVVIEILKLKPDLKLHIKLIGWYSNKEEKSFFERKIADLNDKVKFYYFPYLEFNEYLKEIRDTDIFLDLRSNDIENTHCLPIKIFYFAALKRPVIYSDLKAIRKEIEIDKFGFLVVPSDTEKIANIILKYLENNDLYVFHCNNAGELVANKYNWDLLKDDFIKFVIQVKNR